MKGVVTTCTIFRFAHVIIKEWGYFAWLRCVAKTFWAHIRGRKITFLDIIVRL